VSGTTSRGEEAVRLGELRTHDSQLAFLALLTARDVKPASRWEKALPRELRDVLRSLGLAVRTARRTTLQGRQVVETLFALDPARLERYVARCDGAPIRKGATTRRFEGTFFGYPPCCVEAFAERPYAPNDLSREDQALLFHWACPGCEETPALLERYRELNARLSELP